MTIQQPLPKIIPGECPFCSETIFKENQRTDNYSEFWILLSNGSKLKTGICKTCREKLNDKMISDYLAVHQEYWEKGINEATERKIEEIRSRSQQQIKYYNSLNSLKFALRERDLE